MVTKLNNEAWYVPKPEKGPDGEVLWYPIIRVGRHVPFGYRQDEEDKDLLLPIPEELELLEKAKLYLKEYSLRQVAHWLTNESGRYISHVGLKKRVSIERSRKNKADHARTYARRYKEASEKAKKLDGRLGGRSTVDIPEGHLFDKTNYQWKNKTSGD
jgi:hypothetical protein